MQYTLSSPYRIFDTNKNEYYAKTSGCISTDEDEVINNFEVIAKLNDNLEVTYTLFLDGVEHNDFPENIMVKKDLAINQVCNMYGYPHVIDFIRGGVH